MTIKIDSRIISKERYFYLLVAMLIGMHFFGLLLFNPIYIFIVQNLVLAFCLFLGIHKSDEFSKTIKWLFMAMAGTMISSYVFEGQSFYASYRAGFAFYDFAFFFLIVAINPTIKEIENMILFLGSMALVIYVLQYIKLPTPIVESLTKTWRIESSVEWDLKRFDVNGNSILLLAGLMCTNRLFYKFKWYYLAFVILISAYLVVHGYRSLIIAFLIAYIVLYLKYFKNRFSYNAILGIGFLVFAFVVLSNVKEFQNVLSFMIDKSTKQTKAGSGDIDRFMELKYFWNEYLKAPWEWIFGGGFSGNSSYGAHMLKIQTYGSGSYGQVNWVDLGFIGMSFIGGLVMVGLWVKLLIMCMRRVPREYYYIGAYCLYMILSSLTLNQAFSGNNIEVQCLVFLLFLKVRSEFYYNWLNYKMKALNIKP